MNHADHLFHAAGEALLPFLIESHVHSGIEVERLCVLVGSDRQLWMSALLYAELPSLVDEAAEDAARQVYGGSAGSALRFLAGQVHAQANAVLADTAQQIRDRLAVLVGGGRP